jgi:hypothetical protein
MWRPSKDLAPLLQHSLISAEVKFVQLCVGDHRDGSKRFRGLPNTQVVYDDPDIRSRGLYEVVS